MAPKTYKIVIIGDSNVGKTCMAHRFCNKHYTEHEATVACDIITKLIDLDGEEVILQIWDTVGQERHNALTSSYYRNVKGVLLMYDTTDLLSFNNLRGRIHDMEENLSCDVCKVLVGNKCDDEEKRKVNLKQGQTLADEFNIAFFESSCKKNINIDVAFLTLARNIKEQLGDKNDSDEEKNIQVGEETTKEKSGSSCYCNISNNNFIFGPK